MLEEVRSVVATLERAVRAFDPATVAGGDAVDVVVLLAKARRLSEAGTALAVPRVAESGAWRRHSHAASIEQWLALVSGSSERVARDTVATAERLDDLPNTEQQLRAGNLSMAQAALVSAGAKVDPTAESRLLQTATRDGMRGLIKDKERVIAAATDQEKAHALAVRDRHLRTWERGVATDGHLSGPTEQWARVLQALEPLEREAFAAARTEGRRESADAYRWDALLALAERALTGATIAPTSSKRARTITRVVVGLPRLLDGSVESGAPDDVCEIPGVGPVPESVARDALSHGLLELVISDGVDVQTVVTKTRYIPEALKVAIEHRDPTCKTRGCDRTDHLEGHHIEDFAPNRVTSYRVVGNLCPEHHDLVTNHGYTIETNPDGSWTLRAPPQRDVA